MAATTQTYHHYNATQTYSVILNLKHKA